MLRPYSVLLLSSYSKGLETGRRHPLGGRGVNSIVECVGREEEGRVRVWEHCRRVFTCVFRVGMKGGRETEGGREGGRETEGGREGGRETEGGREGHKARQLEGKEGNRVSYRIFGWGETRWAIKAPPPRPDPSEVMCGVPVLITLVEPATLLICNHFFHLCWSLHIHRYNHTCASIN